MSTLKAANIQSTTTGAPTFKTSAGTEIGHLVKAWVNFDGTGTIAIRDDFNVESLVDNGTGSYTVNFTNSMSNVNYAAVATVGGGSISNASESTQIISRATTDFQIYVASDGTGGSTYTVQNASYVAAAVFAN